MSQRGSSSSCVNEKLLMKMAFEQEDIEDSVPEGQEVDHGEYPQLSMK